MIYLDYSANTPADPEVLRCLAETETRFPGNPNSDHAAGRAAREEMARVTEEAARLLGVLPSEVLFNSGASEGNNTAVKGLAQLSKGRHIVSTPPGARLGQRLPGGPEGTGVRNRPGQRGPGR